MSNGGDKWTRMVVELKGLDWFPVFCATKPYAEWISLRLNQSGRVTGCHSKSSMERIYGPTRARTMMTQVPKPDEQIAQLVEQYISMHKEGPTVSYTVRSIPASLHKAGRRKAWEMGVSYRRYIIGLLEKDNENH